MAEQSTRKSGATEPETTAEAADPGAGRRVSQGILQALEDGRLVPGQRLVEGDLALQYGVGRNAVREAIQWLAAHGVIDVSRFRSSAIRRLDVPAALDVLDIAEMMVGLASRKAAAAFKAAAHADALARARAELDGARDEDRPGAFSRARRHFYRALIEIGGNRELPRLFPSLGMQVVYAQYRVPRLRAAELADLHAMAASVARGACDAAEADGRAHVRHVREAIMSVKG